MPYRFIVELICQKKPACDVALSNIHCSIDQASKYVFPETASHSLILLLCVWQISFSHGVEINLIAAGGSEVALIGLWEYMLNRVDWVDFGQIYFQLGKAQTRHWKQEIPTLNFIFYVSMKKIRIRIFVFHTHLP